VESVVSCITRPLVIFRKMTEGRKARSLTLLVGSMSRRVRKTSSLSRVKGKTHCGSSRVLLPEKGTYPGAAGGVERTRRLTRTTFSPQRAHTSSPRSASEDAALATAPRRHQAFTSGAPDEVAALDQLVLAFV
jgi:hypothetical protein